MRNEITNLIVSELGDVDAIDLSQTAILVERYVLDNGVSKIVSWRDSEAMAMLVLDWLSMHEPVWEKT